MLAGTMRKDAAYLAAFIAALMIFPGAARAGTYQVVSCQAPAGAGINRSWTVEPYNSVGNAPPALSNFTAPAPVESCPSVSSLRIASDVSASKTVKNGDGLAFVFRAPAGNTVTQVSMYRAMQARSSTASAQTPYWIALARAGSGLGGPTIVGTTAGPDYCDGSRPAAGAYCGPAGTFGTLSNSVEGIAGLPVVQWGIECQSTSACATGQSNATNAVMEFQGAVVTVEDSVPPGIEAGSPVDGWHRPSDAIVATGSDSGGIKEMHASIDAHPVAAETYTCDFHLPAPCPTAPPLSIPLAGLSDGVHAVTVAGTDIGANSGRVDRAVGVDGTAPVVELVPTGTGRTIKFGVIDSLSGIKGGEIAIRARKDQPFGPLPTALRNGRLQATVPRGKSPSDFGIRVTVSDNAGNVTAGEATTMSLNRKVGKHLIKVRHASAPGHYGKSFTLTGRLTTVDGTPLAGQQLLVASTLRRPHATPQIFGSVTTGATGRFSINVPVGPSRKFDIAYGGGSGLLGRTRTVTLHVPAHSSIHAGKARVFGAGSVRFHGRLGLKGAELPAGGKIVVLEAFQHGRWSTVATTRARGRRAAWHAKAHFRGNPGTFPIRLRIPRESAFPYDNGTSRSIPIRVF